MSFEEEYDRVNRLWDKSIKGHNKRIKDLESRLAKARAFANELCETPLDPHDDAFSDAPMRVALRRILGAHLKEILK